MNKKYIGISLIIFAIILTIAGYYFKLQEYKYIKEYMLKANTCFLDDGTCLHADRSIIKYIIIFSSSIIIFLIGVYLIAIDKTDEKLIEHQKTITKSLKEAKKADKEKDEFKAYLAGFSEDEKNNKSCKRTRWHQAINIKI